MISNDDFSTLCDLMRNGIVTDAQTGLPFYTGYKYQTLYDWDQYFEAIIQLELGWPPDCILNGMRLFLNAADHRGFIPRSRALEAFRLSEEAEEMAKPFFAQLAVLVARSTGSLDWLTPEDYDRLKRFVLWWLRGLSKDGGALSYWRSGPHTGMDTQHERAGYWRDDFCAGIDLNSYLYRECRAMAIIAAARSLHDDARLFEQEAEKKRNAILTRLWHEADGFFYDLDTRTGAQIRVKSCAGFMPLWAGIATPHQAARLVTEHLTNPDEFWRPFPVPAYAATEPGYREEPVAGIDVGCLWRANTWIPINYVIMHALRRYGYSDLAATLARITHDTVRAIGVYEYYTSDSRRGCGLHPFWGWSLLAYLMPSELAHHTDPTSLDLAAPLTVLK